MANKKLAEAKKLWQLWQKHTEDTDLGRIVAERAFDILLGLLEEAEIARQRADIEDTIT